MQNFIGAERSLRRYKQSKAGRHRIWHGDKIWRGVCGGGAARNLWACRSDLKRPNSFSRFRVSLRKISIALFKPVCADDPRSEESETLQAGYFGWNFHRDGIARLDMANDLAMPSPLMIKLGALASRPKSLRQDRKSVV